MTALLLFLPDEAFVLLPLVIGFLVMFRVLSLGQALLLIVGIGAMFALMPIFSSLLESLPMWLIILLVIVCGFGFLKAVAAALMGKGVSDHFIGSVLHDIFLLPFRLIRWFFRILFRRART